MIRVDDLAVTLGDATILEDVSMAVDDGEFVGLVGPNGAGKTTLLRCLAGVLSPDHGVVTVNGDGVDALSVRETSRRVAVVPQDTTLDFDFTVEDVVAMGRTPHRGRFERASEGDTAVVDDAMERTSVSSFADKSIRAVSGGERQRVILARALAQEAPVLVLDEPTASLDVNHQIRTLDLVEALVDDGRTAVAAIHDLSLAARYCDRLVLLADGGVVAAGSPERVLARESISTAFDADAAIADDPVTGTPAVTALSTPSWTTTAHVHVLGTGPDAGRTVSTLAAAGATVTVGPTPPGDAVALAADGVDAPAITAPPFAGLEEPDQNDVREYATAAACTVLAGRVPSPALDVLPAGTKVLATTTCTLPETAARDESRGNETDSLRATRSDAVDVPRIELADLPTALETDRPHELGHAIATAESSPTDHVDRSAPTAVTDESTTDD